MEENEVEVFTAELEKLELKDGDVVLCRNINGEIVRGLAKKWKDEEKHNLFIIMNRGETIETLNEADMNRYGWYRK